MDAVLCFLLNLLDIVVTSCRPHLCVRFFFLRMLQKHLSSVVAVCRRRHWTYKICRQKLSMGKSPDLRVCLSSIVHFLCITLNFVTIFISSNKRECDWIQKQIFETPFVSLIRFLVI